jgi:hypothetical protein
MDPQHDYLTRQAAIELLRRRDALIAVHSALATMGTMPSESPDRAGVCAAHLLAICTSERMAEDAEMALHHVLQSSVNDGVKDTVAKVLQRVREMRARPAAPVVQP